MSSSGLETIPPSGLCRGDFGLVDIDHNLSCFAGEPLGCVLSRRAPSSRTTRFPISQIGQNFAALDFRRRIGPAICRTLLPIHRTTFFPDELRQRRPDESYRS